MRELRDRLEQELRQQREEQYECVLKRKEQHLAEVPGRGAGRAYHPTQTTLLCTTKGYPRSPFAKPILPLPAANRQDDGAGQREAGCRAEDPQGDLREV